MFSVFLSETTVEILAENVPLMSPFQDKLDYHVFRTPHEQYGAMFFFVFVCFYPLSENLEWLFGLENVTGASGRVVNG